MNTIFPTRTWTKTQRANALKKAKEVCNKWWVDVLDCSKSPLRQKVDISFDEAVEFVESEHQFVISRRKDNIIVFYVMLMTQPSYYLWIEADAHLVMPIIKENMDLCATH